MDASCHSSLIKWLNDSEDKGTCVRGWCCRCVAVIAVSRVCIALECDMGIKKNAQAFLPGRYRTLRGSVYFQVSFTSEQRSRRLWLLTRKDATFASVFRTFHAILNTFIRLCDLEVRYEVSEAYRLSLRNRVVRVRFVRLCRSIQR